MTRNPNWTEEELKMAISLYGKIPFKKTHKTSPEVIYWAKILGRSPGGLYTKLCNLGHFDKSMQKIGVGGLSHTGKLDSIMWRLFEDNPEKIVYEGQQLLAARMGKTIEEFTGIDAKNLPEGKMRETIIRQRVGQCFFREAVLLAYNNHCCITGITIPSLLEACHISSWRDDEKNRTNPKNGICMNAFFHKAYDNYLIAVTPDFEIVVSDQMIECTSDERFQAYLVGLQYRKILMPEKFAPDKELLANHYNTYQAKH